MINYCQEKISPEIHRKFIIETDLKYNILNRNYGGIMDDELKNYSNKYKKSNKSEDFSKNMFKMIVHNLLFNFIIGYRYVRP